MTKIISLHLWWHLCFLFEWFQSYFKVPAVLYIFVQVSLPPLLFQQRADGTSKPALKMILYLFPYLSQLLSVWIFSISVLLSLNSKVEFHIPLLFHEYLNVYSLSRISVIIKAFFWHRAAWTVCIFGRLITCRLHSQTFFPILWVVFLFCWRLSLLHVSF